jgi:hypothetical protein
VWASFKKLRLPMTVISRRTSSCWTSGGPSSQSRVFGPSSPSRERDQLFRFNLRSNSSGEGGGFLSISRTSSESGPVLRPVTTNLPKTLGDWFEYSQHSDCWSSSDLSSSWQAFHGKSPSRLGNSLSTLGPQKRFLNS